MIISPMKVNHNCFKLPSNKDTSATSKKRKLQQDTIDELQPKKFKCGQELPISCSNSDYDEPIACSSCFDSLDIDKLPDDCVLHILVFTDSKWLLTVGSVVRFLRKKFWKNAAFWSIICNTQTIQMNLDNELYNGMKFMISMNIRNIQITARDYVDDDSLLAIFKHVSESVEQVRLNISSYNWKRVIQQIKQFRFPKVKVIHGVYKDLADCLVRGSKRNQLESIKFCHRLVENTSDYLGQLTILKVLTYWRTSLDKLSWMNSVSLGQLVRGTFHDPSTQLLKQLAKFAKNLRELTVYMDGDEEIMEFIPLDNLESLKVYGSSH
jgi:hypothetical protein